MSRLTPEDDGGIVTPTGEYVTRLAEENARLRAELEERNASIRTILTLAAFDEASDPVQAVEIVTQRLTLAKAALGEIVNASWAEFNDSHGVASFQKDRARQVLEDMKG